MLKSESGPVRASLSSKRPLVLCVDDEPFVLSSLERLLRGEPYDLRTTLRPEQILEWIGFEDVSLVISDQRMPGMLGTMLLHEVHRRSPSTVRIMLTGYPGSTLIMKTSLLGIDRMIDKPWDDDALKRVIRELLQERACEERMKENQP